MILMQSPYTWENTAIRQRELIFLQHLPVLGTLYATHLTAQQAHEIGSIIPTLQMKRLRFQEAN